MPTVLNYSPHPAQKRIHAARTVRFRTVCTGRRFGKTLCLAAELLDRGGCELAGDYGWVAPTYNVAERGIEAFRTIAEGFVNVSGRAPSKLEFDGPAGSVRVWFLSADNPDNIRGYGFQGLVIDEAGSMPVDVWTYVLRPTIAQTLGWAVFVSTPKGRNWFYDLFTRGMDANETDYASFKFPSNASPYFPAKEWEEAQRTLPSDVFKQEYLAEFLEDSAGVFRNVDDCLIWDVTTDAGIETAKHAKYAKGDSHEEAQKAQIWRGAECVRNVVVGCDVAKHTDWTVLVAMDAETGRCFAMERFNHLDWPIQKERILAFVRKYRGRLILDATGVGDPIYDDLKCVYGDIEAFKFTAVSKTALVQRLIVAVEQRRVSWPAGRESNRERREKTLKKEEDGIAHELHELTRKGEGLPFDRAQGTASQWDVLTNEMKRYEYQISASGNITYGAPGGYHDDCVMALALANHRRWETENCGRMLRVMGCGRRGGLRARRRERVLVG